MLLPTFILSILMIYDLLFYAHAFIYQRTISFLFFKCMCGYNTLGGACDLFLLCVVFICLFPRTKEGIFGVKGLFSMEGKKGNTKGKGQKMLEGTSELHSSGNKSIVCQEEYNCDTDTWDSFSSFALFLSHLCLFIVFIVMRRIGFVLEYLLVLAFLMDLVLECMVRNGHAWYGMVWYGYWYWYQHGLVNCTQWISIICFDYLSILWHIFVILPALIHGVWSIYSSMG